MNNFLLNDDLKTRRELIKKVSKYLGMFLSFSLVSKIFSPYDICAAEKPPKPKESSKITKTPVNKGRGGGASAPPKVGRGGGAAAPPQAERLRRSK